MSCGIMALNVIFLLSLQFLSPVLTHRHCATKFHSYWKSGLKSLISPTILMKTLQSVLFQLIFPGVGQARIIKRREWRWLKRAGSLPGCLRGTARSCCRRSSSTWTRRLSTTPGRLASAGMTSSESQSGALRGDTELWREGFTTTGSPRPPGSPV